MKKHDFRFLFGFFLLAFGFSSCKSDQKTWFSKVDPSDSGVGFANTLVEDDSVNIIQYLYAYNGGGVGIADLNNDKLPDLYFSSNRGANKLYWNKGNFTFEEADAAAGVAGTGDWKTGVSLADVNGDGLIDIYVCAVGGYKSLQGRNQLLINQGNGQFKDEATAWGVDVEGLSTQACFLDFDRDNDLDMFLIGHSVHSVDAVRDTSERSRFDALSADRLFRNDGQKFTDISREAGILQGRTGYGLGVTSADLNADGWPDLFVGNDFHDNDYVYINNKKGGFTEVSGRVLGHSSYFTMGCDAADVNNDGLVDLITLDMKPDDEQVLKASEPPNPYNIYQYKLKSGFLPQFARNAMQINVGSTADGLPQFAELGQLMGVSATDWSWSALLADFDQDGFKDLHITNGIARRPNDLEFVRFISNPSANSKTDLQLAAEMPEGKVGNYLFANQKGQRFESLGATSGFNAPSLSNGAAYGDLDGDGDLDLVVNNLNAPADLLRNNNISRNNSVFFELEGPKGNHKGIGARVELDLENDQTQVAELQTCRGFESSVEPIVHFGIGKSLEAKGFRVFWPDGKVSYGSATKAGRVVVKHNESKLKTTTNRWQATDLPSLTIAKKSLPLASILGDDTEQQKLLPYQLHSRPKFPIWFEISEIDDIQYLGQGWFQNLATAKTWQGWAEDRVELAAIPADFDGDNDFDLLCVFRGVYSPTQPAGYYLQWMIRDEKIQFKGGPIVICKGRPTDIVAWQADDDADKEYFVATASPEGSYGLSSEPILLDNAAGYWHVIALPESWSKMGMMTDAVAADLDNDGTEELVICGHFMPIIVAKGNKNQWSWSALPQSSGLWNTVLIADLDSDGHLDLVGGNMGKNHYFNATGLDQVRLEVADFDKNGSTDPIITYRRQGKTRTLAARDELAMHMPMIKKQFPDYTKFAAADWPTVFPKIPRLHQSGVETLESSIFYGSATGFSARTPLPDRAQWSPINAFAYSKNSPTSQLWTAGGQPDWQPVIGRLDAAGLLGFTIEKNKKLTLSYQSVGHCWTSLLADAPQSLQFFGYADGRLTQVSTPKSVILH
jgi:enediyne biosynthesis protein E4